MDEFGILEARNNFSALVERAENGEDITITSHGNPVVNLTRATGVTEEQRKKALEAAAWIRANRINNSLGDDTIKDLIEQGR